GESPRRGRWPAPAKRAPRGGGRRRGKKHNPNRPPAVGGRPIPADPCAGLVRRLDRLDEPAPPLRLRSHPRTDELLALSPLDERAYKHREDLIDAVICAWTAALWHRTA